eukprot:362200-Chlamydomonas_euryale.AAC.1
MAESNGTQLERTMQSPPKAAVHQLHPNQDTRDDQQAQTPTLSLCAHNVNGLSNSKEDVHTIIEEQAPDIIVVTETHLHPKQMNKKWVHLTFPGYQIWSSTHANERWGNKGSPSIKQHVVTLSSATQHNSHEDMHGRLAHITMRPPHSAPITYHRSVRPGRTHTRRLSRTRKQYGAIVRHLDTSRTQLC